MARSIPEGCGSSQSQGGVVLIMVLVILAGLGLMLAEFSRLLLTDHSASAVGRVTLAAKPLFASAEHLAAQLLLANHAASNPDTLHEPWADEFSDLLAEISSELDSAEIFGEITDENSRFPLQSMFARNAREQAKATIYAGIFTRLTARLLLLHGLAENGNLAHEKAETFTQAVLYWGGDIGARVDPNHIAWYLERTPSYIPPGTRFLSVSELLLVRWEDVEEAHARKVILGTEGIPGLIDLLSIWSTGPMNINTLHPLLVHALIEDSDQAMQFMSYIQRYRDEPDNDLNASWYQEEALKASGNSGIFPFDCLAVRSNCFRVSLTVAYGAAKAKSTGICRVNTGGLLWYSRTYQ